MKKCFLFILFICNYLFGFSQLLRIAELKLPGNRDLYKINQDQLLITREIRDTAGYVQMELSLYDSALSLRKTTLLKKIKGFLSKVFITDNNKVYVLYHLSYDPKLPLGTTFIFCLDQNLKLLRTTHFSLPNPTYSVLNFTELNKQEVMMYGLYAKSSEQFIVKLNTRNEKLVLFPVKPFKSGKADDFDWALDCESFGEDNRTFVVYNNEKGRNDSTYLRIYSNDGWEERTLRIKLGEGMMMGSAKFYRVKKDHYILYGRYWHSRTDYPDSWGVYLFKFENGQVYNIITKPMAEFPLDDRRSLNLLGLPSNETDLKMKLDSLRGQGIVKNKELVIENEILTKKFGSYFLTANIGRGDIEGSLVAEFDPSLQYKRSVVFPIIYGSRSGNHQYSDFPMGWADNYFNQSYFLNGWLTGCFVDSAFNVRSYYSVNPDPSWSVVYPSRSMVWYDHFLILYGNDDDWETDSDTFFVQKLVLPVQ